MAEYANPFKGDPEEVLKNLENVQKSLKERLASLKELQAGVNGLTTTATDPEGAVTVTVVGRGEIQGLEVTPAGLKMRKDLGPVIVRTVEEARDRHLDRMNDFDPLARLDL
ncbi:YbaB/EbfC family nucleoid-associated protein [Salininema proteolyticum]|uniref:YbaB/EbfC family nucleoid-associated protein n=1 Tax=Salininema proteolyticum TaxID=1607685 RepID=A0ABV8TWC4_9ACTN